MKNILFACVMMLVLGLFSFDAHALSEQSAPVNTDGTAKFADPDEKGPAFLLQGGNSGATNALDPSEYPVNMPSPADRMGITQQGQQAFDRAYSHLQNQNQ